MQVENIKYAISCLSMVLRMAALEGTSENKMERQIFLQIQEDVIKISNTLRIEVQNHNKNLQETNE